MSKFFGILIVSLIAFLQCNCETQNTGFVSRGVIRDLCYNFQKYDILFTGKCHLQPENIEPAFDWFFTFIREYNRDNSVDQLLTYFFKDTVDYFLKQYPQFKPDYDRANFTGMYEKFKGRIGNTTVQEVINVAKVMTNAYNTITTNPKNTCKTDETLCPVLEAMFDIVPVSPFDVTLTKFLSNIKANVIKFLQARHADKLGYEDALLTGLIDYLGEKGTADTNVKKIRQLALSDMYKYLRMLNEYTPEVTRKPIVTNPVKQKTTKIAVTSAVYISIPVAFVVAGVIVCVLIIVLVYRMKPNKGGSQQKTKPADP